MPELDLQTGIKAIVVLPNTIWKVGKNCDKITMNVSEGIIDYSVVRNYKSGPFMICIIPATIVSRTYYCDGSYSK